jgi:glutathione S-transferase
MEVPMAAPSQAQDKLLLVSHHLCPYVQRAVIVADEKGVALTRHSIDLAAKPEWFLQLSPTGKVPLLVVGEAVLFESAAISEYLDEVSEGSLLPHDPIQRARHRAWVEFASGVLSEIARLYNAPDAAAFAATGTSLAGRFRQLEPAVAGPWFAGERFGLVDAAFGPVFRYLDAFERLADVRLAPDLPAVAAWRRSLATRPTVARAVAADYAARLEAFLLARRSHLAGLVRAHAAFPVQREKGSKSKP